MRPSSQFDYTSDVSFLPRGRNPSTERTFPSEMSRLTRMTETKRQIVSKFSKKSVRSCPMIQPATTRRGMTPRAICCEREKRQAKAPREVVRTHDGRSDADADPAIETGERGSSDRRGRNPRQLHLPPQRHPNGRGVFCKTRESAGRLQTRQASTHLRHFRRSG